VIIIILYSAIQLFSLQVCH